MQGRDKENPKSPAEELLEEAFDACMEEQMSFIPPESEIARMPTFSESFQRAMEQLLRTRGKTERRTISRKEFVYGFNRAAAGLLILFCTGRSLRRRPDAAIQKQYQRNGGSCGSAGI